MKIEETVYLGLCFYVINATDYLIHGNMHFTMVCFSQNSNSKYHWREYCSSFFDIDSWMVFDDFDPLKKNDRGLRMMR